MKAFRRLIVVIGMVFISFPAAATQPPTGGPDDFAFEFGTWEVSLRRLTSPLSGSKEWVELRGTSVVRKVWGGRANLGELAVGNADGRIEGLSLRLYNPDTRQWNVYWANSRSPEITAPMVGGFKGGRGEFFNQETYKGRNIHVRFVFSDITPKSFRFEQAFSADGGKTWEPNWIAEFRR